MQHKKRAHIYVKWYQHSYLPWVHWGWLTQGNKEQSCPQASCSLLLYITWQTRQQHSRWGSWCCLMPFLDCLKTLSVHRGKKQIFRARKYQEQNCVTCHATLIRLQSERCPFNKILLRNFVPENENLLRAGCRTSKFNPMTLMNLKMTPMNMTMTLANLKMTLANLKLALPYATHAILTKCNS